jgi:hypothetical protein
MAAVSGVQVTSRTYTGPGGFTGSGNVASSLLFVGPHFIEKQDLQVEYTRVPHGYVQENTFAIGLSGVSGAPVYTVGATSFKCIITANYSVVKSYDAYDTSVYQQPQKFQIERQEYDAEGNFYSCSDYPNALGPKGTVITSQPWISRRPWDVDTDSESTSSVTLANFLRVKYHPNLAGVTTSSLSLQTEPIKHKDQYIGDEEEFSPLYNGEMQTTHGNTPYSIRYTLGGWYHSNKESTNKYISWLDSIGYALRNSVLLSIPAVPTGESWPKFKYFGMHEKYDPNKHDYS